MRRQYRILLPLWIWDKATNNDEFKANLSHYMNKNYPDCYVVKIDKPYGICERG